MALPVIVTEDSTADPLVDLLVKFAREFSRRTHGGMVGIFPFTGHKDSFFGDLHTILSDCLAFELAQV